MTGSMVGPQSDPCSLLVSKQHSLCMAEDPDFDSFFKEAARIEGALVMGQGAITRMGETLLDLRAWAETQAVQFRLPRSDAALLAWVLQLDSAQIPEELTEALARMDQNQKMVQTAVMVIMQALPKAIRSGARLLSEAPKRLEKQGPAALTTTLIAPNGGVLA